MRSIATLLKILFSLMVTAFGWMLIMRNGTVVHSCSLLYSFLAMALVVIWEVAQSGGFSRKTQYFLLVVGVLRTQQS